MPICAPPHLRFPKGAVVLHMCSLLTVMKCEANCIHKLGILRAQETSKEVERICREWLTIAEREKEEVCGASKSTSSTQERKWESPKVVTEGETKPKRK